MFQSPLLGRDFIPESGQGAYCENATLAKLAALICEDLHKYFFSDLQKYSLLTAVYLFVYAELVFLFP